MSKRAYLGLLLVLCGLILGLAACSSTTPVGALGSPVDLRPLLPAEVKARAPADGDADRIQTAQTNVQVGQPPATVQVKWQYFRDGNRAYLLGVSFRVTQSAQDLSLSVAPDPTPIYVGTSDRAIEALRIVITGSRASIWGTQSTDVSGLILANGTWQ